MYTSVCVYMYMYVCVSHQHNYPLGFCESAIVSQASTKLLALFSQSFIGILGT